MGKASCSAQRRVSHLPSHAGSALPPPSWSHAGLPLCERPIWKHRRYLTLPCPFFSVTFKSATVLLVKSSTIPLPGTWMSWMSPFLGFLPGYICPPCPLCCQFPQMGREYSKWLFLVWSAPGMASSRLVRSAHLLWSCLLPHLPDASFSMLEKLSVELR